MLRQLYHLREGVFMLKIVYPISCSINVHKTFVVATFATTDRENISTSNQKCLNILRFGILSTVVLK